MTLFVPTRIVNLPTLCTGLAERKKFREKLSNSQVENGQLKPKVVDTKPPTTSGRPNIHVNPNFLEGRQLSVSEDSQTEDDELKAMEEKIQKLRQKKAEAAKKKEEERKKQQRKKELEAILEQERLELERIEKGEVNIFFIIYCKTIITANIRIFLLFWFLAGWTLFELNLLFIQ